MLIKPEKSSLDRLEAFGDGDRDHGNGPFRTAWASWNRRLLRSSSDH